MSDMAASSVLVQSSERNISAHYWATALLAIAVVPLLRGVGLPLKFEWTAYFAAYWMALTAQSMCAASILYVVGCPYSETIAPIVQRIQQEKARLLFLIPLSGFLFWLAGPAFGFMLIVDAVAILELVDRSNERRCSTANMFLDVFFPAAYLFVIIIGVFAYNDIIAVLRYTGSWQYVLNRADAFILGGHTIPPWSDAVLLRWPRLIPELRMIYFGMFAQVGAAIVILAWREGRSVALKFVGTAAFAYYIALFIFYWVPATGPFSISPEHFSVLPVASQTSEIQRALMGILNQLRLTHTKQFIGTDYFIALPSMHIVLPLIVLWFLRRWKRMVAVLIAYDVLMVAAILLLEWHFLVDLIAAVPVAALAIAINGRDTPLGEVPSE